jgi:hypothetical protein
MFRSKKTRQPETRKARRFRPSPAFVVSMVALLVALSGTAMALPGVNSVNSGDIVNNNLKSIDLKDDAAVASADVIDATLTGTDVAPDTLTGDNVAPDSLQAQDLAPDSVTPSELADNAVTSTKIANNSVTGDDLASISTHLNFVLVAGGAAENGAYVTDQVTASCPAGQTLLSGNGYWFNQQSGEELFLSGVQENRAANTVTVSGGNDSGVNRYLVAVANCI